MAPWGEPVEASIFLVQAQNQDVSPRDMWTMSPKEIKAYFVCVPGNESSNFILPLSMLNSPIFSCYGCFKYALIVLSVTSLAIFSGVQYNQKDLRASVVSWMRPGAVCVSVLPKSASRCHLCSCALTCTLPMEGRWMNGHTSIPHSLYLCRSLNATSFVHTSSDQMQGMLGTQNPLLMLITNWRLVEWEGCM